MLSQYRLEGGNGEDAISVSMTDPRTFLPYHEPDIITILIQSSLVLVLNLTNAVFDAFVSYGLISQIFIGAIWGMPGLSWLSTEF